MVYHQYHSTTSPEEDTEYADIYIPVPYDPEIPGVRCVDAEEVENFTINEKLCSLRHQCEVVVNEIMSRDKKTIFWAVIKLERLLKDVSIKLDVDNRDKRPYDPKIPGVVYVDAEEVENVDVAMVNVNTLSDDGGEDIKLQDLGQGDDLGDVGFLDPSLSKQESQPAEDNLQTGDIEDVV